MKLARSNVSTKYFQFQPQYRGQRRIRITVQLNEDVLTAYLSLYGSNEEVTPVRAVDGTAHEDYILNVCLNRESFQAIPHIIIYKHLQMMVVREGRWPLCWSCKQLGHLAKFCPQKTPTNNSNNNNDNYKEKTTSPTTKPALEPGDHQNNPGERWT